MKAQFILICVLALCLCGCNKNTEESTIPRYMQVEGKIFYQEGMTGSWLSYYYFYTKDSVHCLIPVKHFYGTYKQMNDKVIMNFDSMYTPIRAHVEGDMLVVGNDYFTQTNPEL